MVNKISYKIIQNTRLNEVSFHNTPTYPLYVQITYLRKTTHIKSAYFELLSQKRYGTDLGFQFFPSKIEYAIDLEKKLMDFLVKKYENDFEVIQIGEKYKQYSLDLIDSFLKSFQNDLFFWFADEGMLPASQYISMILDSYSFKEFMGVLDNGLLSDKVKIKLFDSYTISNNPFYTLSDFANKQLKSNILSRYMWEDEYIQERFTNFVTLNYPKCDLKYIKDTIQQKLNPVNFIMP